MKKKRWFLKYDPDVKTGPVLCVTKKDDVKAIETLGPIIYDTQLANNYVSKHMREHHGWATFHLMLELNPNSTKDRPLKTARTVSVPWKYFLGFQGSKINQEFNPVPVYTFIKEVKEAQNEGDADKSNVSLHTLLTSWHSVSALN
jgi:hypothetical protein